MTADFLVTFKWQHLIDILVISFIIHRIFLLLRGSTAFQMLLGLISLLLLQAVAQMAGLVLTSWFFRALGAVALLAIVILFKREIRELLIQTNPVRFFLGHPPMQHFHELEPLVAVVFKLAQSRTGALIVLQNRNPLSEHLQDGFELNGKLIPQIIQSLFAKESPLHDGAIVISGNRIKLVGTFLPLTTREKLPKHFGTRHRAAIGLSEVTDAIVVLVSEERGEVVLFKKGTPKVMRNQQHLRKHLMRLSTDQPANKKLGSRARSWVNQTAGFVLIFLLVSTFWGIYFGRQSLIQVTIPIDFRNIPEDIILKSSSTENVNIQISGNRILINDLEAQDVRIFVNLSGYEPGVHTIDIDGKNVELPTGLAVTQLSPSQIVVELERVIQKQVAVQPRLVGNLPDGRQISQIQVHPDLIQIRGPSSELMYEDVIYTTPIDVSKVESNQKRAVFKVALALPHASVKVIDSKDEQIQVTMEFVTESLDQK